MTRRLRRLVARSGQVEDRRLSLAFLRIEAHHLKNLLGHLSAERKADELLGRLHGYRKVVRPFTARQALRYGAGFFRRHLSAQQLLASATICAIAFLDWSASTNVASSIRRIGFIATTFNTDAAGKSPSCGSMGPRTAFGSITISLAAKAISVPPDMA